MRIRVLVVMAVFGLVGLVGCGPVTGSPSNAATAAASASALPTQELPAADALLGSGAVTGTPWTEMDGVAIDFEADSLHESAEALADAFGAAIHASWAGGPGRPEVAIDFASETGEHALIIISESGFGDDSVAGSQYALLAVADDGGWRLDTLWTRALCSRGVSGQLCV